MVGFGLSLRRARRKGWEGAYVDYENLKLLLTQIETVYEANETSIRQQSSGFVQDGYYVSSGLIDYDHDHDDEFGNYSDQTADSNDNRHGKKKKKGVPTDFRDELFLESDSSVAFASTSEEEDENRFQSSNNEHLYEQNQTGFNDDNRQILPSYNETFSYSYDGGGVDSYGTQGSFNKSSVGAGSYDNEQYPILGDHHAKRPDYQSASTQMRFGTNFNRNVPNRTKKSERAHKRRHGRKRCSRQRHKVPLHIRRANKKARAITRRFLGLLRAEVDKVMLFAHSRMGELADTIGSLRFSDDQEGAPYDGYDDHLSDNGVHSSESSSSDKMGPADGCLASDEDEGSGKSVDTRPKRRKKQKRRTYDNTSTFTKQQVDHSDQLRIARPTFQRSDQVVGDEFLLLSAVDEADAYMAVGVEMMHLLKFISVNVIAIRKISKKHDRLLRNRMLGGYYHKERKRRERESARNPSNATPMTQIGNERLALQSNNSNSNSSLSNLATEFDKVRSPSFNSKGRLIGVYDAKIQNLTDSMTAQIITDSLSLALSEYEVSRRRANALSGLNKHIQPNQSLRSDGSLSMEEQSLCMNFPSINAFSQVSKSYLEVANPRLQSEGRGDDEEHGDSPSTSSSISLTRLRFVVASVIGLREAARRKLDPFNDFLSRSVMTRFCSSYVGDAQGMEGCSRQTLNFFVEYNPDAAFFLDSQTLHQCLDSEDGKSANAVVSSCLAVGTELIPSADVYSGKMFNSINIVLGSKLGKDEKNSPLSPALSISQQRFLRLNLISAALSTMNYYIIVPSAASFCRKLGGKSTHAVLLICATSITSFITAIVHAHLLSNQEKETTVLYNLRSRLILCSIFAFIGNALYSISFEYGGIKMAFLGRLLVGFSFSELINKRIIAINVSRGNIVEEVGALRKAHMRGLLMGVLCGAIFNVDEKSIMIGNQTLLFNFQTFPGYCMCCLWLVQIIGLLCSSDGPNNVTQPKTKSADSSPTPDLPSSERSIHSEVSKIANLEDFMVRRGSSQMSIAESVESKMPPSGKKKKGGFISFVKLLNRTRKLMFFNLALPISLLSLLFASLTMEIIFSSCAIIFHRYFKFSGPQAGFYLSVLASLVYPVYIVAAHWSRSRDERTVMKKSLVLLLFGIAIFVNYEALIIMFLHVRDIFQKQPSSFQTPPTYYDWYLGRLQYCIGAGVIFMCCICLEAVTLSLISKVSPARLNLSPFNCSLIAPLIICLGRMIGDVILVTVCFSHKIVNADMVNVISFYLLLLSYPCLHLIKKHFFFLNSA